MFCSRELAFLGEVWNSCSLHGFVFLVRALEVNIFMSVFAIRGSCSCMATAPLIGQHGSQEDDASCGEEVQIHAEAHDGALPDKEGCAW